MNHIKYLSITLMSALILLSGCGASAPASPSAASVNKDPEASEKSVIFVDSMDTYMTLTAYGSARNAALSAAEDEILRLNDLFSIGVDSSEIARANRGETLTVSSDTEAIISRAEEIYSMTDGLYDISITPLMDLWGFTTKLYHIPTHREIEECRAHMGMDKISLTDSELSLAQGTRIDLGGIAKGYASQKIMEIFRDNGVQSGIVSLGGNAQCIGTKPDGSNWKIGIRMPWGNDEDLAGILAVHDCAVITSGGYERYFTDQESGKTYCHIIDPISGIPVENGIQSVTIISEDGVLADALSTSLFIMGLEHGSEFWREHSDLFEAVFIDNDNVLHVTAGIIDSLSTNLKTEIIQ